MPGVRGTGVSPDPPPEYVEEGEPVPCARCHGTGDLDEADRIDRDREMGLNDDF